MVIAMLVDPSHNKSEEKWNCKGNFSSNISQGDIHDNNPSVSEYFAKFSMVSSLIFNVYDVYH